MKTFHSVIITAATALLLAGNAYSQTTRTFDQSAIEATAIKDHDRYETLLDRFISGDRTLTPDEVATIYYGFRHTAGFNPAPSYAALMNAYDKHDYTRALDMARMALTNNPVSLPLLFKAYACANISPDPEVKAKATTYQTRINQICDVIFSSGKGVSTYNPYIVLRASDIEPFVKNYLQPDVILDSSPVGNQQAVKMRFGGIPDDVILYFGTY